MDDCVLPSSDTVILYKNNEGLPNTSPLDHEALKAHEGVNEGGRLDPLRKIFGSALANQIVSLPAIFQIIIFVNELHNSPGSKEKKSFACSIVPFVQDT